MSETSLVAIILGSLTVLGSLGGVYLGYWLQDKSAKQERKRARLEKQRDHYEEWITATTLLPEKIRSELKSNSSDVLLSLRKELHDKDVKGYSVVQSFGEIGDKELAVKVLELQNLITECLRAVAQRDVTNEVDLLKKVVSIDVAIRKRFRELVEQT